MDSGLNTFTDHVSQVQAFAWTQNTRSKVGFPIRKSSDQSSFAAPQGLSQRTTSFIASQRQGIHRTPLRHLITLMIDVRRPKTATIDRKTIARGLPFGSPEHMLANQARDRHGARAPWLVSGGCGSPLLEPDSSSRFQTSAADPEGRHANLDDTGQGEALVEPDGIEPTTSCLQSTRSPN